MIQQTSLVISDRPEFVDEVCVVDDVPRVRVHLPQCAFNRVSDTGTPLRDRFYAIAMHLLVCD